MFLMKIVWRLLLGKLHFSLPSKCSLPSNSLAMSTSRLINLYVKPCSSLIKIISFIATEGKRILEFNRNKMSLSNIRK